MRYIPWKRIRSWRCIPSCNVCCRRLRATLTSAEYLKMLSSFGPQTVDITDSPGKIFIKHIGGRCIFNYQDQGMWFCHLHQLGMKPFSCRMWPFMILTEPPKRRDEGDGSIFMYEGRTYHVYVDVRCLGIEFGNPDRFLMHKLIPEAIDMAHDINLQPKYLKGSHDSLHYSSLVGCDYI